MRNRRRRVSTGSQRSMVSQLLALSLFIMLLAFFIVLNAISNFEETRYKPIMSSLGQTFASRVTHQENFEPSVAPSEDESISEGSTLERMRALFSGQIPGQESAINQTRGTLYIRVPLGEFEQAVMGIGQAPPTGRRSLNQPMGGLFLPTLVSLMRGDEAGLPYRMDMVLNIRENPAALLNDEPLRSAALLRKMSGIAGKIEAAGLPQRLISAGVQKGPSDTVDLVFRRHEPFNPAGASREP